MLIEFELIFNGPTLPGSVFIHQNKCNNSHNTKTQEQEVWKGTGGGSHVPENESKMIGEGFLK